MRELSLAELDLVVGGYSQDNFAGYEAYENSAVANGDGSYSLSVTEQQYTADAANATAAGWEVEGSGTWSGGGLTATIKVKKSC